MRKAFAKAEEAGAATTFCVDGREKAEKNPVRFINAARTPEPLVSYGQLHEVEDTIYAAHQASFNIRMKRVGSIGPQRHTDVATAAEKFLSCAV